MTFVEQVCHKTRKQATVILNILNLLDGVNTRYTVDYNCKFYIQVYTLKLNVKCALKYRKRYTQMSYMYVNVLKMVKKRGRDEVVICVWIPMFNYFLKLKTLQDNNVENHN